MIEYRPLAYISPQTNNRLEFVYDGKISDETTHNLGEFGFSGVDGKFYQDKSLTTGAYPFALKLKNEEGLRELRAAFLEKATPESIGTLEHPDPTIGSFPAVVSSFGVNQNSLRGKGVIDVQVTFFRTIPDLLSGDSFAQQNPASAQSAQANIDKLNENQATDLENSVDLSTGAGIAAFVQSTASIVTNAKNSLEALTLGIDEISIAFTDAYLDIINNVETYVTTPFELARKIQNLIQLPMIATNSVRNRTAAYQEFLSGNETFSIEDTAEITSGSPAGKTTLANKAMASLAATSAVNYSAVSGLSVSIDKIKSGEPFEDIGYLSRSQIVDTIKLVENQAIFTIELYSEFASNFGADIFFSQYFDYSVLSKELLANTILNLNNRIFSSVAEKSVVTAREITPIELCSDLYQSVELSTIEFLIESNKLCGDKIFIVPKGTKILYY